MAKQAKANLKWIEEQYKPSTTYKVYALDSRNLSRRVKACDVVASEPFMGPFLNSLPTESEARRTVSQLKPLYIKVLEELKKVTKKRIVIIAPKFRTKNKKKIHLNLEIILQRLGLKYQKPLLYTAPKSKMIREIWIIDL